MSLLLFSHSVLSDSLGPLGLKQTTFLVPHCLLELAQTHVHWIGDVIQPFRPPTSPSSPAFNLSQHPSFPMNQFFSSYGQSFGVLASASVLPMNIQSWFPLGLTGLILLKSKRLSRVLQHYNLKASVLQHSSFFMVQSHIHAWLLGKV